MARPKNHVIMVNNKIMSVNPKNLKDGLEKIANGAAPNWAGKFIGDLTANMNSLTSEQAKDMINNLFPAKERAVVGEEEAA